MESSTFEIYPENKDQEIKPISKEEKGEMRKKMAGLIREEFMTQAIEDHLIKVSALKESDKVEFNRIINGELRVGSEEFKKYAKEVDSYLNRKAQDSGNHSDPRHNLVALMRCLESAQKELVVKSAKEALIKEAENGLVEIKKENLAVGEYLDEMVKKYMPKLRNCDFELIRDYNKLNNQYVANFEEKLRGYFKNEMIGNEAPKTIEGKINLVANHPRYHFYKAICMAKGYNPIEVNNFIT